MTTENDSGIDKLNQQWAESYAELESINKELLEAAVELVELLTWESTATDVELHDGDWDERRTTGLAKAQTAIAKAKS